MERKTRKSAATILAENWGWDRADVEEHRYRYGHTRQPIYALEDGYYCVSPTPPKDDYKWEVWQGNQDVAAAYGTTIWHAKAS